MLAGCVCVYTYHNRQNPKFLAEMINSRRADLEVNNETKCTGKVYKICNHFISFQFGVY